MSLLKVAANKVGMLDLTIMHENSAEERDMIGGGWRVVDHKLKIQQRAMKSETLSTVFPYCFKRVELRGEDFS